MSSIDAVELINNLPQDMKGEVMNHIETLYLTSRMNYIVHFDKYVKRAERVIEKIYQTHKPMITQCVAIGVSHYDATVPYELCVDVEDDGSFTMYDYSGLEIVGSLVTGPEDVSLLDQNFPEDEPCGISDEITNMFMDYAY